VHNLSFFLLSFTLDALPWLQKRNGISSFQIQIFHPVQTHSSSLHLKYDDNDHSDPSWAFFTFVILAKHKQVCDWDMFHHSTVGCIFFEFESNSGNLSKLY
jgi:hypothetical protein